MKKTVLFVCVENAGRSQMAEGFFRKYAPAGYSAVSAGSRPVGQVNSVAIEAMKEVGIDIGVQKTKMITEEMVRESVKAVNMGCMDKAGCPMLFISNVVDWGMEDPKGKPIERVRQIRDEIERRVQGLVADLEKSS